MSFREAAFRSSTRRSRAASSAPPTARWRSWRAATQAERARTAAVWKRWARASFATGPIGSGHAVKALNNYVSAAGLAAACEAAIIAEKFGVDPNVLVDVLNVSTGRNNSTEAEDEAVHPVGQLCVRVRHGVDGEGSADRSRPRRSSSMSRRKARGRPRALWAAAMSALGKGADHTEIYRFLAARSGKPK